MIRFQKEIQKLKAGLVYLSSKVETNLNSVIEAIMERDYDKAKQAVELDKEIDTLEVELEEECLKILALHQPVASDLRLVVAILKMNNDLERIGDLAGNIGKNAMFLSSRKPVSVPFDYQKMASHAREMLHLSLKALTEASPEKAEKVREMDDYLDGINNSMYTIVHDFIQKNPENLDHYIHMASISRALERIGDLAVNMAEDVIYLHQGKIVRHQGALS